MNINPNILVQQVQAQGGPKQMVMNILENQMNQNPLCANLLNLAKDNKQDEIEMVVRNAFKENGLDFDTEFQNFKNQFGIK